MFKGSMALQKLSKLLHCNYNMCVSEIISTGKLRNKAGAMLLVNKYKMI